MQHQGTKTLETERLILRKFTMADAEAMYFNWASDEDVTKYLTWPHHESIDTTRHVLEDWISHYQNDDYYQWAIVLKKTKEPIGSISIVESNEEVSMVEVGYCIGKQWWHQGYTSEALEAVIRFLFAEVCANRIQAKHDIHNPDSGKVMAKCGMQYEGILRQYARNNTGICDVCLYAIVKEDRKG